MATDLGPGNDPDHRPGLVELLDQLISLAAFSVG
jgi:hypothetical protein